MGCRSGGKWNASWLEQAVDEEKGANIVWRCPGLRRKMLPDAERMADQVVRKEVWLLKAGSGGRGGRGVGWQTPALRQTHASGHRAEKAYIHKSIYFLLWLGLVTKPRTRSRIALAKENFFSSREAQ